MVDIWSHSIHYTDFFLHLVQIVEITFSNQNLEKSDCSKKYGQTNLNDSTVFKKGKYIYKPWLALLYRIEIPNRKP